MFRKNKKSLALTISALIFFLAFATTGYAASIQSTLTAQFVSFKIMLNDQLITPKDSLGNSVSPLLVNNTTYLPLRAFGDIFNKNVDWNNTLKQISITDKPDNEIASLKAQIKDKDNQIVILKAQLSAKENAVTTLSGMEDQLNKDYRDYEKLKVAVTLSGTTGKITVSVDVGNKTDWSNLTSSKQTRLLQNIADDINDEFDEPSITGTVKVGSKTINSFTVKSNGTISIGTTLNNLEDTLNSDYSKIDTLSITDIVLEGDEDDIVYTININYSKSSSNKNKWDSLSNSKIESYMDDIYDDIENKYSNADIQGYICDTNDGENMAKLYMSGTSLKFRRYLP